MKKETRAVLDSGYQGTQHQHANTELARQRITNEHVIGSIKRFKITAERYRNRRKRYVKMENALAAIDHSENKQALEPV